MRASFEDFIIKNPNCKKFENDNDMRSVFKFLSSDHIIIQMIDASEAGKPALTPVATCVENYFADINTQHINTLDDSFTKQAVGLMIKAILEPFGYEVLKQNDLPKSTGATKFQSASTYRFNAERPMTMRIVRSIEEIKINSRKEITMLDWEIVRPVVENVLRRYRYSSSGSSQNGTPCFLTAYQIAVLVDKINPNLKGNLPIGGKDAGSDDSFARQIAIHLSNDVERNYYGLGLLKQFFCTSGLDDFTFNGGCRPSSSTISMFRLAD